MPKAKYYNVTRTEKIRVSATNELDALKIATAEFETGESNDVLPEDVWGRPIGKAEVVNLLVEVTT